MSHRVLINIATALALVSGVQACSSDRAESDFRVLVTAQGTCKVAGEILDCSAVGSRLLPLCPNTECSVLIEADAGSKAELLTVAFKSLTETRFARVSIEIRS